MSGISLSLSKLSLRWLLLTLAIFFLLPAEEVEAARARAKRPPAAPVPVVETIQKITVTGNKKIEQEAILEKIKSAAGKAISRDTVREDIQAIHKMGYFDSVQVEFEAGTLIYKVKERPTISKVIFFGNDQVSTDDLKSTLSIKTYDIFDENLVRESVRKLAQHYEDKGFYLAKVTHEVRYSKDREQVEVLFRVREYDKVRVRKITFLGNEAFDDAQLKRTLRGTQEGDFFSWLTSSGNFKDMDFKTDLQILQYFYLSEGYVRFQYEAPVVSVSEDKKWVYITIKVKEGKRYKIAGIDFAGDLLFPKEELHNTLTLKETDWFSNIKLTADREALTEKYEDLGYAYVNVVPQTDINDEALTVGLTYEFEKGTLVRFGRISVKGDSKTRDKVIRRELKIREGELYTGSGMRISKENVERLGFFEQGKVEFQTNSPPGRPDVMDVNINVKEVPTGQFQLGAGYSTTSKFFFTTSIAETNFLGKGQDLRFSAQVAADRKNRSFSISFTDPYAFDSNWSVGGDLYSTVSTIPARNVEYRKGVGLRMGYPLEDYTRLYVGYKYEEIRLQDVQDPFLRRNEDRENGALSSVSVTVASDKRNNRMDPSAGHYASLSEEVAGLGGNRRFTRTILDTRLYRRVIGDLVFRTKFEVGNITSTDGNPVQSSEKFFLGGPGNLKGFPPYRVGPKATENGIEYYDGANNELFYIAELEYPIVRDVGLKFVVFYDAGHAFNKFKEFRLHQDWGWGIRWLSPLGPLRFEWGYPLDPKGLRGSQFNFNIGPPF